MKGTGGGSFHSTIKKKEVLAEAKDPRNLHSHLAGMSDSVAESHHHYWRSKTATELFHVLTTLYHPSTAHQLGWLRNPRAPDYELGAEY
jgi:hypothetical protein